MCATVTGGIYLSPVRILTTVLDILLPLPLCVFSPLPVLTTTNSRSCYYRGPILTTAYSRHRTHALTTRVYRSAHRL